MKTQQATAAVTAAAAAAAQSAVAAEAAVALAQRAAETAKALAEAKTASDVAIAVLGNDISRIKTDIGTINLTLKDMVSGSVSKIDFTEHTKTSLDLETRIKVLETSVTKLMAWGSAVLVFSGILQAVAFHFWK